MQPLLQAPACFIQATKRQGILFLLKKAVILLRRLLLQAIPGPKAKYAIIMAIDCNNDGFEDIAGMAYGGAATRSRLFCYSGGNTELYSINSIEPTDIIE